MGGPLLFLLLSIVIDMLNNSPTTEKVYIYIYTSVENLLKMHT